MRRLCGMIQGPAAPWADRARCDRVVPGRRRTDTCNSPSRHWTGAPSQRYGGEGERKACTAPSRHRKRGIGESGEAYPNLVSTPVDEAGPEAGRSATSVQDFRHACLCACEHSDQGFDDPITGLGAGWAPVTGVQTPSARPYMQYARNMHISGYVCAGKCHFSW